MRQRRPADPTDPGDAADLSIMGYLASNRTYSPSRLRLISEGTVAQERLKINSFLTTAVRIACVKVNAPSFSSVG